MGRFVLRLIAIMVAWLMVQSGYDLRVQAQCRDYQKVVKVPTVYSNGVCYIGDGPETKFRKEK